MPISSRWAWPGTSGVDVGDTVTWDVQGVTIPTRVASLREVEWARFEPNFFVVFPEGPLDAAPQTFLTLTRVADADRIARGCSARWRRHFPTSPRWTSPRCRRSSRR